MYCSISLLYEEDESKYEEKVEHGTESFLLDQGVAALGDEIARGELLQRVLRTPRARPRTPR